MCYQNIFAEVSEASEKNIGSSTLLYFLTTFLWHILYRYKKLYNLIQCIQVSLIFPTFADTLISEMSRFGLQMI